jgi:spermidine/putrescine transport system permease protein
MAREGTTPALSALAVIIIAISLPSAIAYEIMKRREERQSAKLAEQAKRAELAVAVAAPA